MPASAPSHLTAAVALVGRALRPYDVREGIACEQHIRTATSHGKNMAQDVQLVIRKVSRSALRLPGTTSYRYRK